MEQDLVSIITPAYNCGRFINETIQSVQAQTYTNWEMIIVDDCSTDDTESVVALFLKDDRIRYIQNRVHSGAAISRNRALRAAKGRWIAFLDSDDLWMPNKLERQIGFMEANGYSFSYTQYCKIDENSNDLQILVTGPKHITKYGMYKYNWIGCLTVMYDANEIGLIQITDIKSRNDYAMWLRVSQKTNCHLLNENLAKYRKRINSLSNRRAMQLIKCNYQLFRKAEGCSILNSYFNTFCNIVCFLYKKIFYEKHNKRI